MHHLSKDQRKEESVVLFFGFSKTHLSFFFLGYFEKFKFKEPLIPGISKNSESNHRPVLGISKLSKNHWFSWKNHQFFLEVFPSSLIFKFFCGVSSRGRYHKNIICWVSARGLACHGVYLSDDHNNNKSSPSTKIKNLNKYNCTDNNWFKNYTKWQLH